MAVGYAIGCYLVRVNRTASQSSIEPSTPVSVSIILFAMTYEEVYMTSNQSHGHLVDTAVHDESFLNIMTF